MKMLPCLTLAVAAGGLWLIPPSVAQDFQVLYKFTGSPDGQTPTGLAGGPGGVLYGTTAYGGAGYGTIFALQSPTDPNGTWTETILHTFTDENGDGASPLAPVTVGPGGVLYGVTSAGGPDYGGSVFEMQPPSEAGGPWTEIQIVSNYFLEGGLTRPLTLGPQGVLYGVTSSGYEYYANGSIFELTPPAAAGDEWTVDLLYSFNVDTPEQGLDPLSVSLGKDGALYGATAYGGTYNAGTVFSMTPSSTLPGTFVYTVLYSFSGGPDGANPLAPPVLGNGGVLYGSASGGGSVDSGVVYRLTPPAASGGSWTESVIYDFGPGDGKLPDSLTLRGYALFGTTASGTSLGNQGGSVFELLPSSGEWTEVVLHNFGAAGGPQGSLWLDKNGSIYGVTAGGPGENGYGMVYRINQTRAAE
jgi:uncharacterized repeat protein (TIGR03803 family)